MDSAKGPLSKSAFLTIFVMGSLLLVAAVIWLKAPDELLLFAVAGVAYPASVYSGRFYLVPMPVFSVVAIGATLATGSLTPATVIHVLVFIMMSFALGEALYRLTAERSRRIAALLDSQAMLEEAQSIAHVGHFTRDRVSGRGEWSREMYAIHGLDPAAGAPTLAQWEMTIHPDDRARVQEAQRLAIEEGAPINLEYRIIRPDGEVRFLRSRGYRKPLRPGQPPTLIGAVADITWQAVAQQSLRESEARIRALIESSPLAILIVDSTGNIVQANRAIETVFGYKPDEVVGKSFEMLMPDDARAIHHEQLPDFLENPGIRMMGHGRELIGVSKDGKLIPVEIGLSVMTAGDQALGIAWVADISERKHAENALRQSEQYFKLLHETGRDLSISLDLDAIHDSSFRAISQVMDCDGLIISSYSRADDLIRGVYARLDGKLVDAQEFPPIPLEPEGQGTQSLVIRGGEPLIIPDFQEQLKHTTTSYQVGPDGIVPDEAEPEDGQITRSAVLVPLKLEGETVGVLQVLSYRLDAYTEQHLRFLESLAAHIVLARKNAMLFKQVQQELSERKQAEQALVESERLYRSVFEDISLGLAIIDTGGHVLAFNEALLRPGGYTAEDVKRVKAMRHLFYEPAVFLNIFRIVRETGSVEHEPVRFKRKDGTPYEALLSLIPITMAGKPGWHAIIEDLTAQRQFEAEIRLLFSAQERHLAELEALRRVTLDITKQLDLDLLLAELVGDALSLLDAETGGIYLYRPTHDDLELHFEFGGGTTFVGVILKRGEGIAGRVLERERPLIVENYSEWEGRSPLYEKRGLGSVVGVPVMWGSEMLGVIDATTIDSDRVFTKVDADLLSRFADQAAIAIHNARMYETEQKARMVAEMMYATSVALTLSLDLGERLDVFLKNLQSLVPYDSANVMLLEPDGSLVIQAARGYERYGVRSRQPGTIYQPGELAGVNKVITTLRTVHVADTAQYKGWVILPDSTNIRCWIGVPLIADGEVIGLYGLDKAEPGFFTEEHRYAAETLAAQAAIAIQNARLFESETRQLKLAHTLQKVGALLTTRVQLDEVFEHIFDLLAEVVDYDSVSVFLIDEADQVTLGAQRGFDDVEKLMRAVRRLGPDLIKAHWWHMNETVVIADTEASPGWITMEGAEHVRSWMGAPLVVKGRRIGVLSVDSSRPNVFDARAVETVAAFANQAAVAIENTRLFAQTENRNLRLQLLNEITRIGTETLDLASLLDSIVKIAAQLIGGDSASITLWDEQQRITAMTSVSGSLAEPLNQIKLPAGLEALTSTALRQGHPLAIEDYYPHSDSALPARPGVASSLLLPLQVGQHSLGALFIDFRSQHHFTDDEIVWSSQAAELIALAIAKSEVYEDLERRVEQRTAELRSANDRLVALTRLKDEFVSNVSHELRTPIASIKLYHSLVSMRPEKQEAYLEHLHRETKRLENIVEGLLHLSRLDQDHIEMDHDPLNLNQIAEQFVADRILLAEEHGLSLTCEAAPEPQVVPGDLALLGQAISVLFTNALNYTPRGGSIVIRTADAQRDGKPGATLSIRDTGPGVPPAELPHLFERFFRGSVARASAVPGTGLGLSIAHEIVGRHGGKLEVQSTGQPGEGACFTIWLPAEDTEDGLTGPDEAG